MQLQSDAALMERFRLTRAELYELPQSTIEKMELMIEADGKAQSGATKG